MKTFVLIAIASTLTVAVFAGDPLTIARQRAKDTSQAVGGNQPAAAARPAPAPNNPAPINPALVAMQQNISSLAADLGALQSDPSKKLLLVNDLNAAAQGTNPTKASVGKLAADLATALNGKKLSLDPRTKLAQYLRAISNSSHLSPAQQRTILEDFQKILQTGGISAEDSAKVLADLKAIAAETK